MKYQIHTKSPNSAKQDCLILGVYEGGELSEKNLSKALTSEIKSILKKENFTGTSDKAPLNALINDASFERILLVALGKKDKLKEKGYIASLQAIAARLKDLNAKSALYTLLNVNVGKHDMAWKIKQFIYQVSASHYIFDELKSQKKKQKPILSSIIFQLTEKEEKEATTAIKMATATTEGIAFTKDLGNRPGNVLTPRNFAKEAEKLGKKYKSLNVKIFTEADLKKLKMNTFLSVARGSDEPPRMIQMEYKGTAKKTQPIVLVGKGVTFDSGGTSLKPGPAMDEMKYDMCGAGTVAGVIKALAEMKAPVHVIGVIGATENMPGAHATKPGDIVTSMSGQTVEILNTDAEGRLVLCDLLTYVKKFKPKVVLDIATLTGAMVMAMGSQAFGFFTEDDKLAQQLIDAGNDAWDRAWRFPLWEEYQDGLHSNFADMANIGERMAGAITAASFLHRFAKDYTWAHLDIAGIAWNGGKAKGASGRPVPTIMEYILNYA